MLRCLLRLAPEGDGLVGTMHQMDMNTLAGPPASGDLRPIGAADLPPAEPDSQRLPRLIFEWRRDGASQRAGGRPGGRPVSTSGAEPRLSQNSSVRWWRRSTAPCAHSLIAAPSRVVMLTR